MSIWNYKEIKNNFNKDTTFITLNEGNTLMDRIRDPNKLKPDVLIKREDLNPTGSWKDRGTAFKMTELLSKNINEAVISSSGNAAISFLTYSKLILDFKLHIVISPNIHNIKLKKIEELILNTHHQLYITKNTRKLSIEIAAKNKIINLRASIDNNILKGYWSLGFELAKLIREEKNEKVGIFIPVSSGTTLVGIVQGLFSKLEKEYLIPKIFVCQTQNVHPIYDTFLNMSKLDKTKSSLIDEKSTADSIIDSIALRTPQVIKIIKETHGSILKISNNEIKNAQIYARKFSINNLSPTSLLSLAGYLKNNENLDKVICIASGL